MGGCTNRIKEEEVKSHESLRNIKNDDLFILEDEFTYLNNVSRYFDT